MIGVEGLGFRGSSRFESVILSHHSRFKITCECNKEEINDDDNGFGVMGIISKSVISYISWDHVIRILPSG